MNPKDKAQEILNRFYLLTAGATVGEYDKNYANTLGVADLAMMIHEKTITATAVAKKCALVHVGEMLKTKPDHTIMEYGCNYVSIHGYYSKVKQELEKL